MHDWILVSLIFSRYSWEEVKALEGDTHWNLARGESLREGHKLENFTSLMLSIHFFEPDHGNHDQLGIYASLCRLRNQCHYVSVVIILVCLYYQDK